VCDHTDPHYQAYCTTGRHERGSDG
jgi:hypothetical protein